MQMKPLHSRRWSLPRDQSTGLTLADLDSRSPNYSAHKKPLLESKRKNFNITFKSRYFKSIEASTSTQNITQTLTSRTNMTFYYLIALLALAATVAAVPVHEILHPRICGSVAIPSHLIQLKEHHPNHPFPNTAHTGNSFFVFQDVNGSIDRFWVQFHHFLLQPPLVEGLRSKTVMVGSYFLCGVTLNIDLAIRAVVDRVNQLVEFAGPVGAHGCSLGITFPTGYVFKLGHAPQLH